MGCTQSKDMPLNAHPTDGVGKARTKGKGRGGRKIVTVPTSPMSTDSNSGGNPNTNPSFSLRRVHIPKEISKISDPGERLQELLDVVNNKQKHGQGGSGSDIDDHVLLWGRIIKICDKCPMAASYVDANTRDTPLHLACRILAKYPFDSMDVNIGGNGGEPYAGPTPLDALRILTRSDPEIAGRVNRKGYIAVHEIIRANSPLHTDESILHQTEAINLLLAADYEASLEYLSRNDVCFDTKSGSGRTSASNSNNNSMKNDGADACTPLYHAVSSLPDDFFTPQGKSSPGPGPTVKFISAIHFPNPQMVSIPNVAATNHDSPLALLYRRFSRQFDTSEQFFPGDNSLPAVTSHRNQFKAAAMNTWKIILALLDPLLDKKKSVSDFYMVHAAVGMDGCPPDLLRYIIETRPEEVRQTNDRGRLPLHVAAAACGDSNADAGLIANNGVRRKATAMATSSDATSYSRYHFKFVIDELLYAYPEACAEKDADNMLPLQLAVESEKAWIGGGTKSMYDVYPDAMGRVEVEEFPRIKSALSFSTNFVEEREAEAEAESESENASGNSNSNGGGNNGKNSIVKEEHYDAIMMVQKPDANLGDVISAMWANEEDGGVQMLGCVAISRMAMQAHANDRSGDLVRAMALTAVTTVVNAMKNHPNEPAVQEKACGALRLLASADNYRDVSFAASGAAASIVAAMQAHVSDAIVQQEACTALCQIIKHGGPDRATVIASVSGFTALQNALGAHPDAAIVQKEACLALDALTSFPDANLPDLPGSQTGPLLEAARQRYPFECQEPANRILARLSS